jgi:hypothetical protein
MLSVSLRARQKAGSKDSLLVNTSVKKVAVALRFIPEAIFMATTAIATSAP